VLPAVDLLITFSVQLCVQHHGHLGSPGQNPEGRKLVVVVAVVLT